MSVFYRNVEVIIWSHDNNVIRVRRLMITPFHFFASAAVSIKVIDVTLANLDCGLKIKYMAKSWTLLQDRPFPSTKQTLIILLLSSLVCQCKLLIQYSWVLPPMFALGIPSSHTSRCHPLTLPLGLAQTPTSIIGASVANKWANHKQSKTNKNLPQPSRQTQRKKCSSLSLSLTHSL